MVSEDTMNLNIHLSQGLNETRALSVSQRYSDTDHDVVSALVIYLWTNLATLN